MGFGIAYIRVKMGWMVYIRWATIYIQSILMLLIFISWITAHFEAIGFVRA